ncbi:MAG TPA: AMP-binding protein [Chryseosolibacter sp.]
MNGSYPYTSLSINGRLVSFSQIMSGEEIPQTPFESTTFSFISSWFAGTTQFEITTSGSTGTPKRIFITRDQMIASAKLTAQVLGLRPSDSCLVCIDTRFIGGRMMLVRAFTIGLQIFAVDPCANPLEKLPPDQWVNFAAFVPYQVEHILHSSNPLVLNRLNKAIVGGAPLRQSTVEALDHYECKCWATYGMTETISHVALQALNGKDKQNYFECLPGTAVELDDRNCLILNVPFLNDQIITNDVAELLDRTRFRWLGRFDNIINTGGIKVSPEKVEGTLQPFFEESGRSLRYFVHGIQDDQLGSRVVLVIEANTIDEDFLKSLRTFLTSTLPQFEIPKSTLLVSKFSETENGKINRLQTVKGVHAIVSLK